MENTKKPAFNIFDALVVLLVLVVVFAGFWLFGRDSAAGYTKEVDIEYKVEFENIVSDCKDDAKIGDLVKDAIKKETLGTVANFITEPQTKITYDYTDINNPKAVRTVVPGLFKVTLTIKAKANESDAAFKVSGIDIKAGKAMSLQSTNFAGEGYCTSVNVKRI